MGFLDGLFGKDDINKLQKLLLDKDLEIVRLSTNFGQLNAARTLLEGELLNQTQIADQLKNVLGKVTEKNRSLETEVQRLLSELENYRIAISIQKQNDSDLIAKLQSTLEYTKNQVLAANKQCDELEIDLRSKKNWYLEKDRLYSEREFKLAEKSEKLLSERQKFQQQLSDLQKRESEWKNRIEPKIAQYQLHLSIDDKQLQLEKYRVFLDEREKKIILHEADLKRRDATDITLRERQSDLQDWNTRLDEQQEDFNANFANLQKKITDLSERENNLENLSQELSAFQIRADQLDVEAAQLERKSQALEQKIQAQKLKHTERLSEIRKIESEVAKAKGVLGQREQNLKARENEVQKEERNLLVVKNKNRLLLNDNKALRTQLENLVGSDSERSALQQSLDALSAQFEETKSAFLHPTVLAWLAEDGDFVRAHVKDGWLGVSGTGPWKQSLFKSCLKELGYAFYPLSDDDHTCVIVGRNGWSASDLRDLINAHQGQSLRIYSQEMFLAKLATGRDPFDSHNADLLESFAEDHPALQFLMALPDPWPYVTEISSAEVTLVPPGSYGGVSQSPLNILDYHAGVTANQTAAIRRKILVQCLASRHLPFSDDSSADYIAQWGRSNSAQRLYRIALHLKILAEGQGKDPRKYQARIDWINDSKWLKENYFYMYKHAFAWPAI